jgi:hypothetical protein
VGAAATARKAGEEKLEAQLRLHLANAYGYGGHPAEALEQVDRLRELARALRSDYVDIGVRSLEAGGRYLIGDHAAAHRIFGELAVRLEALGAFSDAARLHRMSSLASRGSGDLRSAHAALQEAERLATAGRARGTLATVRGDLAEVLLEIGDPSADDALEAALDAALVVGNLRAAGITRARLGRLRNDPAGVAHGALDLWFADRRRAAVAVVRLADLLDPGHELRRALPWAIPAMVTSWGTPLDDEQSSAVAPFLAQPEPPPHGWEDDIHDLLRDVATAMG